MDVAGLGCVQRGGYENTGDLILRENLHCFVEGILQEKCTLLTRGVCKAADITTLAI